MGRNKLKNNKTTGEKRKPLAVLCTGVHNTGSIHSKNIPTILNTNTVQRIGPVGAIQMRRIYIRTWLERVPKLVRPNNMVPVRKKHGKINVHNNTNNVSGAIQNSTVHGIQHKPADSKLLRAGNIRSSNNNGNIQIGRSTALKKNRSVRSILPGTGKRIHE